MKMVAFIVVVKQEQIEGTEKEVRFDWTRFETCFTSNCGKTQ